MEENLKNWLKQIKLHESTISMLLGVLVVVVVGVLIYNFFTSGQETGEALDEGATTEEYALELEEEAEGELVPQGLPREHSVSLGEDLWKISEKYYGNGYNWTDIALENELSNPGLIEEGQTLTIPKVALRVPIEVETLQEDLAENNVFVISSGTYEVKNGDTLWSIAVRAYQDGYQWPEIYQANLDILTDPNIIEIGMQLNLPR